MHSLNYLHLNHYKMYFSNLIKSIRLLIFAVDFSLVQFRSLSAEKSQLFLGKYPIPSNVEFPLDINTSEVKHMTLSPLIITSLIAEQSLVKNTGHAIEVVKTKNNFAVTVTGGPLKKDIYEFHLTRFYWTGNTSGPAATLVDGANEVPIEALALWYNLKYGSFENSTQYRDGVAALSFPVKIVKGSLIPSTTEISFIPFAKKLKQVQKPGSVVPVLLLEHFIWFDGQALLLNTPYFSYPGSYTDQKTSKTYYCTIHIVFQPQINYITEEQFYEYIVPLKNSEGGQLTNAVQSHPQGDTPVIQAEGQIQIFIPFGGGLTDVSLLHEEIKSISLPSL